MTISTASSRRVLRFSENRTTHVLLGVFGAVWLWAAIAPLSRFDWFLENLLVFAAIGVLTFVTHKYPLSDVSNILVTLFLCLHVAGSHYTYSEVPWGQWLKETFNHERNHYDRMVHFSFGLLLAYPYRELIIRGTGIRTLASYFFTFAIVVACSDIYEIVEWLVATLVEPAAGTAFLGSQGDPFDAQKDAALALLGVVLTLSITAIAERAGRGVKWK